MTEPGTVVEAVVLAAGNGARLRCANDDPKPLIPVVGRPLLARTIEAIARAGIHTIHVVTGHRAAAVRACPLDTIDAVDVHWIHNDRYDEANGLSLAAAEHAVSGPFLLLMADHVFEPGTIDDLLAVAGHGRDMTLAVDRKLARVWDLEDATKVRSSGAQIEAIGKSISPYDAIDTGLFVCPLTVFGSMRGSISRGDCSLSGGVGAMANGPGVRTWDIGPRRWIDVDTPGALAAANVLVGGWSNPSRG